MKDKDLVAKYMNHFLECSAYFGYTKDVNMVQVTQVYRRIYKMPRECKIDDLLNFLVVLALSNTYYGDFDDKSKAFIQGALDIIEDQFTGVEYVHARRPADVKDKSMTTDNKIKLSYFKQMTTPVKTYNK